MKTLRAKLAVVSISAFCGILLYRLAGQLGETIGGIRDRHPDMGLGGWLLFGLWFMTAVAVGIVSDHFWKDKKLFLPGDVPIAVMLLYMTVSAIVYFAFYLGIGS